MRRGTLGHVAVPHGLTRRLRGADVTCIFIFIVSIRVIVHISISYSEFKLTRLFNAHYKPDKFP